MGRGDRVRGLIRNPDHAADLRADGSEQVLCDLEAAGGDEVAAAIAGAGAVVFAAVLHEPRSAHLILYVTSGDTPVEEALTAVLSL